LTASYLIQAAEEYEKAKAEGKPTILSFAKGYYDGGFEDDMTKREAALILGVRESATKERIQEAHRRLLMLNHPDTGGSTLIATKINEAKNMLLKNSQ
jgi:DnaJ family protein C protein 19